MGTSAYSLRTHRRAKKSIEDSPRDVRHMFKNALKQLVEDDPFTRGHRLNGKLEGYFSFELSCRGTAYRVVYRIDKEARIVYVLDAVSHEEYNRRLRMGY